MMNSEILSKTPLMPPLKKTAYLFLLVSFLGFLDAAYLTVIHYTGGELKCGFFGGCGVVTTSVYSVIAGIPVSLLGTVYYLILFFLVYAYADTQRINIMKIVSWLTLIGVGASLWFLFLQVFIIKALCLYCLISATTSFSLFGIGAYTIYTTRNFLQYSSQ